ncbi:MAG: hypothetical protein GT589_02045 [Peptoclostridium sp.]|uniref:hypothetical protein n=1 Tax=Peptoclostridium sp. TaxID=1904860 RepID=UPI00139EDEBD|nr:hypothetical protein [Peptoclostridium sp.]MZQ74922.1 hypothetical protein [Peptoclostridium sp.]
MKLTPVLEQGLEVLRNNKVLYRRKDIGVPYVYVPEKYREPGTKVPWYEPINAQTINRLVMLGYAEFENKKEVVKYIDKVEAAIKFLEAEGYKVTR